MSTPQYEDAHDAVEPYVEPTLLEIADAPPPPEAKKAKKPLVPKTPDNDSASDIIGAWVDWYQGRTGVPIPQNIIARLAKQVKSLIMSGYRTNQIKFGLGVWAIEQFDKPQLPPQALDTYVWKFARDTSPQARDMQAKMKAEVHAFHRGNGTAPPMSMTKKQSREHHTAANLDQWLARKDQESDR